VIPAPSGLIDALRYSHRAGCRVEAVYDGDVVGEVAVSGGSVKMDMDSDGYASADLQLGDDYWLADARGSGLLPFGHRLRIHYQISSGQYTGEVPLGPDLLVTSAPTDAGVLSSWTVHAGSLVQQVMDARFLVPWQPAAGTTVWTAIDALLDEAVPGVSITHNGTDAPCPDGLVWERERWDAVTALAARVGCTVRPWGDGFHVAPEPPGTIPDTAPVWTIDAGPTGVLLTDTSLPEVAREQRYNAVAAYNGDDPAVWAAAYIDDAASAIRWDGPFGRKPYFYASTLLTTPAQAQSAADTILARLSGKSRRVELACAPNPTLLPGDLVDVVWPTMQQEIMMIRAVTVPLSPGGGGMKLTLQGDPS